MAFNQTTDVTHPQPRSRRKKQLQHPPTYRNSPTHNTLPLCGPHTSAPQLLLLLCQLDQVGLAPSVQAVISEQAAELMPVYAAASSSASLPPSLLAILLEESTDGGAGTVPISDNRDEVASETSPLPVPSAAATPALPAAPFCFCRVAAAVAAPAAATALALPAAAAPPLLRLLDS